jgi:hypothetical protein
MMPGICDLSEMGAPQESLERLEEIEVCGLDLAGSYCNSNQQARRSHENRTIE